VRARVLTAGAVLVAVAGAASASASTAEPADGPWVWPLAGPHAVHRPFSPPLTRYGPGHRGADLPGVVGQPVLAAGAGRVSYAGLLAGRGVLVVVHGELRTTYEPVTAAVRVGQPVAAGEVIGRLAAGHTGCAPACLHWGLLRGEAYLDPVHLVRRGPSRLLPLEGAGADQPAADGRVAPAVPTGRREALASAPARPGDAASAGGALAALVAGLMLLRRPPPPPDRPVTPALSAPGTEPAPTAALVEPHTVGLVDLAAERHRRRPEVA
jgi:murein DD-endopeptidase MepM/ murein hydrolase activator NlpD